MPFKRKANEIRNRDTPRGRLCKDKGRIDWTDAPVSQRKTTPAREELYTCFQKEPSLGFPTL